MTNPHADRLTPEQIDAEVARSHLDAAGWSLDAGVSGNVVRHHFVYLTDFRHQTTVLASLDMDSFAALPRDVDADELASAVASLSADRARGALTEAQWAEGRLLLFAYIRATGTYEQWIRVVDAGERMHALINAYEPGWVRPAMARTDGVVMSTHRLADMVREITRLDMQSHPEWFPTRPFVLGSGKA